MPRDPETIETMERLSEPFPVDEVKWKPQAVKGNRCLAIAYIDARLVQDRLDAVLGAENWQDSYEILPGGSVCCRLNVRLGGEWVCKTDVGSLSDQLDSGDRLKAAFSDALKRAAVKYGIGRYLYALHGGWVDYDPVKKQIVQKPQLPSWAIPKGDIGPPSTATEQHQQPTSTSADLPKTGQEFWRRLNAYADALVKDRSIESRDILLGEIDLQCDAVALPRETREWKPEHIATATAFVKKFLVDLRKKSQSKAPAG